MPAFQQVIEQIRNPQENFELRKKLMTEIESITKRKIIIYAADFKKNNNMLDLTDKAGFADILEQVEGQDVDIFLQSPGGSAEATEQIVSMIREMCRSVRFIIAHTAKSAATMMALSGDSILMGYEAELGPIDPQVLVPVHGGAMYVPAQTILDGFDKARRLIQEEGPQAIPAYMPLVSKYDLHLLEICQNSRDLAEQLVKEWLAKYMFAGEADGIVKADTIATYLAGHKNFLSHSRSLNIVKAKELGLNVQNTRHVDKDLASKVWKLYCCIENYFDASPAVKVFENNEGTSWSRNAPMVFQMQAENPAQAEQSNT